MAQIATDTGLATRAVIKEAVRLAECGLLTINGQQLTADLALLRSTANTIEAGLPTTRLLTDDPVLARHFRHGRLVAVPDDLKLRHRLANVVVQLLQTDREMTKQEVNDLVGQVFDDHATLRRLLADMGRVTRNGSAQYRVTTPATTGD